MADFSPKLSANRLIIKLLRKQMSGQSVTNLISNIWFESNERSEQGHSNAPLKPNVGIDFVRHLNPLFFKSMTK